MTSNSFIDERSTNIKKRILLWFQRDLRVRDNIIFETLARSPSEALGLVFLPKLASPFQIAFFRQSVRDLQKQLEKFKIKVYVLRESPELELVRWINSNAISAVMTSTPSNSRDQELLERVNLSINKNTKARLLTLDQSTLIQREDLPFSISELPLVFTNFRRLVEASWNIRPPVDAMTAPLQGFEPTIPNSATIFDLSSETDDCQLPFDFKGGETAAWMRVKEYLWDTKSLSSYKENRNGMIAKNDSSKFSPWLASGCISPRSLYWEVKNYEAQIGANDSTYWLIFELLWRDYFKFLSLKIGDKLFSEQGLRPTPVTWSEDSEKFQSWCEGSTGLDFVDANMRELRQTGWMSNRGRQNVANFLAKNLRINWTWGARFFEHHLIDYDPESNWGNWQYTAGVGTDPRDRVFNIDRQASMYDPTFEYRKKWLSEE